MMSSELRKHHSNLTRQKRVLDVDERMYDGALIDIQNQPTERTVMKRTLSYVVIDEAVEAAGVAGEDQQYSEIEQGVVVTRTVHDGEWLFDDSLMAMWGEGDGFFEFCIAEGIEEMSPATIAENIANYRIMADSNELGDEPCDETISKFIVSRKTFDLWSFSLFVAVCHEQQMNLKFKEAEVWILEADQRLVQVL